MNEQDAAIREFLAESYENLDQLEHDLVSIESEPGNRETVDRIFRTVHSIKGACGFLAYPKYMITTTIDGLKSPLSSVKDILFTVSALPFKRDS